MATENAIVPVERIQQYIYVIRGHKVMIDSDLALLYGVETKVLVRAVKRNIDRFPEDFMFQLSRSEFENLRCQIDTSKIGRGGRRYAPYAFTEQGVAMLSSVLKSKRAIEVNIAIMRTFVKLRQILADNIALRRKLEEHDEKIKYIFRILGDMLEKNEKPRKRIGYQTEMEGHKKVKKNKN
ncbi:MAG: ORF6N domain-containing protein [Phycisphaerae bacterium]|jgi:phage regulator Rha-like protein